MLVVLPELTRRYEVRLAEQDILAGQRLHDHQWLRYYLDFCHKYSLAPTDCLGLSAFQGQPRAKHQPEPLCQQTGHAVSRYWEVLSWQISFFKGRIERIPTNRCSLLRKHLGQYLQDFCLR